jgi:predicted CDP-diglyceride synthetase/phosphatidate cytidylyltransferase
MMLVATALCLFLVPAVICRVVSRVTHWQKVEVGGAAQNIDDFKGGRLLALNAVVVDRIDQVDRIVFGKVSGDVQAVIKVSCHLQHVGFVGDSLAELAHRNFSIRNQHRAGQSPVGGVGSCRR